MSRTMLWGIRRKSQGQGVDAVRSEARQGCGFEEAATGMMDPNLQTGRVAGVLCFGPGGWRESRRKIGGICLLT